jgi:lipoic acid synthetase
LKVNIPGGKEYKKIKQQLKHSNLHTICEAAKCPNLSECFGKGTATYLILGDICTRNCRYCHVSHGTPKALNENEPMDVALSVKNLNLSYVVLTSVTRDDIEDGGARMFAETIKSVRRIMPQCKIEVLIPDFKGNRQSIHMVLDANPDILNHNIEVVNDLFPFIRPEGNYLQSLKVLSYTKQYNQKMITKSGFMVGLGETNDQIIELLLDLKNVGVDILTIGQYLQPTKNHTKVEKYYTPNEFAELSRQAKQMGFTHVESGPLVRSSYHAEEAYNHIYAH